MKIEYKVEGAIIRADFHRGAVPRHPDRGPGLILTITGDDDTRHAYRTAMALTANWDVDDRAVDDAKEAFRKKPRFAEMLAHMEETSRGNASIERWMLLAYRMLGEPYLAHVERVECPDGREEWRLMNAPDNSNNARRTLCTGIWVPDESIYDEMEDLARAFAYGSIDQIDAGGFLVRTVEGRVRHFTDKQHAKHWLFRHARPWLEDYTPEQQASAMTRAAWDKAQEALKLGNALINGETYTATASLIGSGGYRMDLTTEGLIGVDAANEAMHGLIEQLNPTAYPTPRMH